MSEVSKIPEFKDVAKNSSNLEGTKITMLELLNKPVIIYQFRVLKSKFDTGKEVLQIQLELDNELRVIFTESKVIRNQLEDIQDKLPVRATFKKERNYYTLS